jgi:hypothetical protein
MANEVGRLVLQSLERQGLRLLSLDLVLRLLLKGQTELYGWDLAPETQRAGAGARVEDAEDLDEEAWYARQREEESTVMQLENEEVVSALISASERADGRAHLALALLTKNDWDELPAPDYRDGRHWYERSRSGEKLRGVEREWAEDYLRRVEEERRAETHLATAADLGQPDALLLMAQRHADPRFFELQAPTVHAEPIVIARLADDMGYLEAATRWWELAAARGNLHAMRALMRESQSTDVLRCWTWFHLAKLHGKDLTQDDYRAIHEDGSPYNDDVGGPLFAVGEDGIDLPQADEATQKSAEARALEIFSGSGHGEEDRGA